MLRMLWRAADNALAETIISLFKAEVIHRHGPWRSFEALEYVTLKWVDYGVVKETPLFNNRRLLELIANIPPAEAEANFHAALERSDLAAWLKQISIRLTRGRFRPPVGAALICGAMCRGEDQFAPHAPEVFVRKGCARHSR
jgi:hypothetical protein